MEGYLFVFREGYLTFTFLQVIYQWKMGAPECFVDVGLLLKMVDIPASYVGVSKNRGTPKWMVYNEKPY